MVFGYTPLDPLVVVFGTALAIWFLGRNPVRLMAYMPTALSLYFFIPTITLMTLWQTVPLLLTARLALKGKLRAAAFAQPMVAFFCLAFMFSAIYAILLGDDPNRAVIRSIYYLGIIALFSFSYEMGRHPEALHLVMKGFFIIGAVYAIFGLYQIVAWRLGLPLRGILRGTHGADIAFEAGLVRINSLANEPKRLGFVLFVSMMACIALARTRAAPLKLYAWAGFIAFMSVFTFAGSYFLALAVFIPSALLLYPTRATKYVFALAVGVAVIATAFPELGVIDALREGYERRTAEVEVGLDGRFVYRQEFYAWDYLARHPGAAFTGVGLGQYFTELNQVYGEGVGRGQRGILIPLNSMFLEMLFDLGGVTSAAVYGTLALLIWRLRVAGEHFLCLSLLFLVIQSLTILTLLFIAFIAGVGCARVAARTAAPRTGRPRPYLLAESERVFVPHPPPSLHLRPDDRRG